MDRHRGTYTGQFIYCGKKCTAAALSRAPKQRSRPCRMIIAVQTEPERRRGSVADKQAPSELRSELDFRSDRRA